MHQERKTTDHSPSRARRPISFGNPSTHLSLALNAVAEPGLHHALSDSMRATRMHAYRTVVTSGEFRECLPKVHWLVTSMERTSTSPGRCRGFKLLPRNVACGCCWTPAAGSSCCDRLVAMFRAYSGNCCTCQE